MQTFTQTFAAPQMWILNVPGKYFTILGCTNPVNVRFWKGGQLLSLGTISQLLAGLEVTLGDIADTSFAFDRVEIDVTADTVQVGIGNGQARYNRSQGNVSITNTPNVTVASLPATPWSGSPTVNVGNIRGAFTSAQATVTNASTQIVAANANRRYLLIQNNDAAGAIFINLSGAAATLLNGIKIPAGGSYENDSGYSSSGAVTAIGSIASNANVVVVEG